MSDKITGIPVKRKTKLGDNSQNNSGSKTDGDFVKKSQNFSQDFSDNKKTNLNKMAGERNESKLESEKQKSSVEQTKQNEQQTDRNNSNKDMLPEGNFGIASLSYSSDQNVLYYAVLSVVTLLAFATRLYKLDVPAWVW